MPRDLWILAMAFVAICIITAIGRYFPAPAPVQICKTERWINVVDAVVSMIELARRFEESDE